MDEHLPRQKIEYAEKVETHLEPKDGVVDARVMFDLVRLLQQAEKAVRPKKGTYRKPRAGELTPEQAMAIERAEAKIETIAEQSEPIAEEFKKRIEKDGSNATANEVLAAEAEIAALSAWLRKNNLGMRVRGKPDETEE